MNRTIFCGRMTADPEVRYTGKDAFCVASFSIAVDRKYKRDDEPTADFIRCVAFGKTAEMIEKFFYKGKRILVEGHIQTGSYTKDDGAKVYTTDNVVESFYFVDSKNDGGNGGGSEERPQSAPNQNKPKSSGGRGKKNNDLPPGFEELEDEMPF